MLKNDAARGLIVNLPNRDKLTMRLKPLKTRDHILSLSKDEALVSAVFSILQSAAPYPPPPAIAARV